MLLLYMRPRARCGDHAWSLLNDKQHEETLLVLDVLLRFFCNEFAGARTLKEP